MQKRIYNGKICNEYVQSIVQKALHWVGWEANIKPGIRLFLKPNFTYPLYKEGGNNLT
jgi:hypothetical protein